MLLPLSAYSTGQWESDEGAHCVLILIPTLTFHYSLPLPGRLHSFAGGLVAMYAWRSFYLSEAVSTRMKALLFADYIRRGLFGRDLSRL